MQVPQGDIGEDLRECGGVHGPEPADMDVTLAVRRSGAHNRQVTRCDQRTADLVRLGCLGSLIVDPRDPGDDLPSDLDLLVSGSSQTKVLFAEERDESQGDLGRFRRRQEEQTICGIVGYRAMNMRAKRF